MKEDEKKIQELTNKKKRKRKRKNQKLNTT
jgi:hypothetical protein